MAFRIDSRLARTSTVSMVASGSEMSFESPVPLEEAFPCERTIVGLKSKGSTAKIAAIQHATWLSVGLLHPADVPELSIATFPP